MVNKKGYSGNCITTNTANLLISDNDQVGDFGRFCCFWSADNAADSRQDLLKLSGNSLAVFSVHSTAGLAAVEQTTAVLTQTWLATASLGSSVLKRALEIAGSS